MPKLFQNVVLGLDDDLGPKVEELVPGHSGYNILRQSLDARRRRAAPNFIYTIEVFEPGETPRTPSIEIEPVPYKGDPVLIVGSGPAGLFAALRLAERGIPSEIFEQGSECDRRLRAINRFWRYNELDPRNNVGFGEGGAGLYSDGKLITRIRSPHIAYVMDRLVSFGAPPEIRYLSNPHVGSDRIRRLIPKLRSRLEQLGVKLHFDSKVTKILANARAVEGVQTEDGRTFRSGRLILACGHSADDMFRHLAEIGVTMQGKSFAVGLRVEHPQAHINSIQYREYANHPKLEAANYKLTHTDPRTKIGVYSFCMCPGGYVLSSGTEPGRLVANGMSNYKRNSPYANSAIVVTVDYEACFGKDVFAGLNWRNALEARAFKMVLDNGGTKELPVQTVPDFLKGKSGGALPTSCPSGVTPACLDELLEEKFTKALKESLQTFDKWMPGFIYEKAQLHGVESRTSCPLRIVRDPQTFQSLSHKGLYPSGEGAGYAGGITSAACDGISVAEAIVTETVSAKI